MELIIAVWATSCLRCLPEWLESATSEPFCGGDAIFRLDPLALSVNLNLECGLVMAGVAEALTSDFHVDCGPLVMLSAV